MAEAFQQLATKVRLTKGGGEGRGGEGSTQVSIIGQPGRGLPAAGDNGGGPHTVWQSPSLQS